MTSFHNALNEYKQTNIDAGTAYADPHTLISMLFEGLQVKLAVAKGGMERQDFAIKGEAIGKAMDIITYLQACLDKEKGGEISANLNALYDYMNDYLLRASAQNSPALLDEVSGLIRDVEGAWKAIRVAINQAPGQQLSAVGI